MRWLELTVEVDSEAVEAVSEILGRLGRGAAVRPTRLLRDPADELAVREDTAAPYELTAHLPDDGEAKAAIERTERALWHLQAFGLRPVGDLRVRPVDDRDWTEAWKEGYQPQRIGRLMIIPSWLDASRGGGAVVRMDPGMAFGTGLHPTTRACLAMLQELDPMPELVLDVGCGSGILGIAALVLGARSVDALDTDPEAVAATAANVEANGLAGRLQVRRGTLADEAPAQYQLVMANLVAAVLIALADPLHAHTSGGGTLLASGIIAERGPEVESALTGSGFDLAERRVDGEWVSLRLVRP